MATVYIYSGATGAASGASWTDAYTTIQAALSSYTAGDELWVAHDHNEISGSTITLTESGADITNRIMLMRVNRTTDVYDPTDGADTKQYDLSGSADLNFGSVEAVWCGFHFECNDNYIAASSGTTQSFIDCYFKYTAGASRFELGSNNCDTALEFTNCTFDYDSTSGQMWIAAYVRFLGCTFKGDMASGGFFNNKSSTRPVILDCDACNFSGFTNPVSEPIFEAPSSEIVYRARMRNCEIRSGQTIIGALSNDTQEAIVERTSHNGDTFINELHVLRGTVETDTGVYYTGTDAFQDYDGDTPLSRELVPASGATHLSNLKGLGIPTVITSTGSKTFTVECIENYTTALTKREAWLEIHYLGSATSSLFTVADPDREVVETSYTNLAAGSGLADWTGEPTGSRSVKLTGTVTVNQIGLAMVYVRLGKYESGKQFFYNPVATVS